MNAVPTFDASEIRPIGAIVAELVEDLLRSQLDGMNAKGRKQFLLDLRARGAITDDDLAFWFYVYPDMRAA